MEKISRGSEMAECLRKEFYIYRKGAREYFRRMAIGVISLAVTLLNIVDKIATEYLGITLFKVTKEAVMYGLSPEAKAEAERPEIKVPLGHTIEGLSQMHSLGAVGRITQMQIMRSLLINRAEVTKALRDYPDVTKIPIRRPVFIVGFPRTGTTMLHHLMEQDPQFRAPMLWEMQHPTPPGRPDDWQSCDRYTKSKWMFDICRYVFLSSDNIHELRAELPEECHFLLDKNFFGIQNMVRFERLEPLTNWFLNLSHEEIAKIYQRYKSQLQMINYGADMEKQRLLLKGNVHLRSTDELLETFPDAQIIFTYRKLTQVVPSMASMLLNLTPAWGKIDAYYGRRCARLLGEMGNRTVKSMAKYDHLPENERPFHVVAYPDLVQDPIATVRAIYKQMNTELTPEVESRMRTWLAEHPKDKNGRHRYSMAEYNLREDDLRDCFKDYIEYFESRTEQQLL